MDGIILLRNRLEADVIRAHAVGRRILDVGPGDGAQALAGQDRQVTRLDPAAATHDALPADGSFDSLIALHALEHAADWRQLLPEWVRAVRSGGRLIFDLCSPGPSSETVPALLAEAERRGLAVVDSIPYGVCLGLADKAFFQRLLSWLAEDAALYELALLIEQEVVARLTPAVAGRCLAVFEKRADAAARRSWLARSQALDACLRKTPIDVAGLAAQLGVPLDELRRRVTELATGSLRCRRLLDCLAAPLVDSGRLRWRDLVAPPLAAYFVEIAEKRATDWLATEWSLHAPRDVSSVAQLLQHDGVPLGDGLEYALVEPLLTRGLGCFTGVRS